MSDSILDILFDVVVVDTDVMSYVFKNDTRGALYDRHLAGKSLIISFVTFGELQRWAIRSKWGASKRQNLEAYLSPVLVFHSDDDLCVQWAKITEDGRRKGAPDPAWRWLDCSDRSLAQCSADHTQPAGLRQQSLD